MRVILHVGMHKTGSTSLQDALWRHAEEFISSGVYPVVLPRVKSASGDVLSRESLGRYLREAYDLGCSSLLISGEWMSKMKSARMQEIVSAFSGENVEIFVVFRHWVSFLPSRWIQNCKRTDAQSFTSFLRRCRLAGSECIELNFEVVLRRLLESGAGRVIVLGFERAAASGDLTAAQLDAMGINLPAGYLAQRSNRSPRASEVERLRMFNAVRADLFGLPRDQLFEVEEGSSREFFDQRRLVADILLKDPSLEVALGDVLKTREKFVRLRQEDFADAEAKIESAARPYLASAHTDGTLFHSVPDNTLRVSELEYNDLQLHLQERMITRMEQHLRSENFKARLPKFLRTKRIERLLRLS